MIGVGIHAGKRSYSSPLRHFVPLLHGEDGWGDGWYRGETLTQLGIQSGRASFQMEEVLSRDQSMILFVALN